MVTTTPNANAPVTGIPIPADKLDPKKFITRQGKRYGWLKRRRTDGNWKLALTFIINGTYHADKTGASMEQRPTMEIRQWFRNFCGNNGIRGAQKESAWRIVHSQMLLARAEYRQTLKAA